MFFIVWIFLAVHTRSLLGTDYWDDNFDPNKNCEAEEEIIKLSRFSNPQRCAVTKKGEHFQEPKTFNIIDLSIFKVN